MTWLIAVLLGFTAVSGTIVVLNRDPRRQVFALSANGIVLGTLFFVLSAPDVALSEIVVGSAVTPLLILVTLAALRVNGSRR